MSDNPHESSKKNVKKVRIDQRLVELGLASSRNKAQSYILSGIVLVNDEPVTTAGKQVLETATIRLKEDPTPFVSRGAYKLEYAIQMFAIKVHERICLDVGASTGGFTQVLLNNGAKVVYAYDVGHNQLDWKIRSDPRVRVKEKFNIRNIVNEDLPEKPSLVVIDVSFISLTKVLPALVKVLLEGTECVALIKPQFEVGKERIGKKGIVEEKEYRMEAAKVVVDEAQKIGFKIKGICGSPIKGTEGNIEYLVWMVKVLNDQGQGSDTKSVLADLDKIESAHENT